MLRFIIITAFFTLIFIAMVIMHISCIWLWAAFIIVWTIAEFVAARDVHLKWWQWALFLAGLAVIDLIVLNLRG